MKIKNAIVAAAAVGAISLAGAAPVRASADVELCRIMGPAYVDGVRQCVCLVAATIGQTGLPDAQWVCDV